MAAQFRQSLRLGDEPLTGAGEYWQQGVGNSRRTCWQWKTLVDGQTAAFCQVLRQGRPTVDRHARCQDERTVTRVDVGAVRRELSLARDGAGQGGAGRDRRSSELLARGGLSQLVAELRRRFTFGPPRAATDEGRDVLAVVGRWREEAVGARRGRRSTPTSPDDWPAHLPHHVVVVVGRCDLFPYVIEYRRGGRRRVGRRSLASRSGRSAGAVRVLRRAAAATMRAAVRVPVDGCRVARRDRDVVEQLRPRRRRRTVRPSGGTWRK